MGRLGTAVGFGKRVFTEFGEKNVTFMAAGLAYNAFISLTPMLLLLFIVLSLVGGGLESRVVEAAGAWLPGPIADVVTDLFESESGLGSASVVGLVVLLWGTLKIFRGLDTAFSEIYETVDDNSFTDKLRDGVIVFAALVFAVLATVGASAAFAVFAAAVPVARYLTPLVLFAGLVVAFLPMYYVFPDTELGLRDVLPGAVFAAVGWAAFQGLFQVYLTVSDPGSGSFFGSVIVIVTYLYFSGLVLLLGAVINAVVGDHSTGQPGGVGRGAAEHQVERAESMSPTELAGYLRGLSADLTGLDVELRPSEPDDQRHPGPADDVRVVEHASSADGERTVTISWSPEGRSGRADPSPGD